MYKVIQTLEQMMSASSQLLQESIAATSKL